MKKETKRVLIFVFVCVLIWTLVFLNFAFAFTPAQEAVIDKVANETSLTEAEKTILKSEILNISDIVSNETSFVTQLNITLIELNESVEKFQEEFDIAITNLDFSKYNDSQELIALETRVATLENKTLEESEVEVYNAKLEYYKGLAKLKEEEDLKIEQDTLEDTFLSYLTGEKQEEKQVVIGNTTHDLKEEFEKLEDQISKRALKSEIPKTDEFILKSTVVLWFIVLVLGIIIAGVTIYTKEYKPLKEEVEFLKTQIGTNGKEDQNDKF